MDRNNIIGIVLIFILFMVWSQINESNSRKVKEKNRIEQETQSSNTKDDNQTVKELPSNTNEVDTPSSDQPSETNQDEVEQRLKFKFGAFASSAAGESQNIILENDLIKLSFDTKGGFINEATIKEYEKWSSPDRKKNEPVILKMLNDPKNKFYYTLPIDGSSEGMVKTSDLYFTPSLSGNILTMTATTQTGGYFRQIYELEEDNYNLKYKIEISDIGSSWKKDYNSVELYWENWLSRLEVNTNFEKTYSTIYFRPADANPDYCSCRSDDSDDAKNKPIKWFSHANQFFNSSLIADASFNNGLFTTRMLADSSENLKVTTATVQVPIHPGAPKFDMNLFVGPNEFDKLRAYGEYVEDIIPFGTSIFGSINRWVVRPLFNFLKSWIFSAGLVILTLTLIVKLLLSPLTYKMLYSQSKMSALKPEMEVLRAKFKEDPQQQQVESMKLYREYGVNPLGGCMPMLLQMPIWFALYRFFPASIEFRQKSFLWATDLSSYDVIAFLPFNIPFYGDHVSLFTLLWAGTTVAYTYYNSKMMDMNSINPAMKYIQYLMPFMFLFFFNSFAAGLSCYLFFSNVLNIGQILVTKNYFINHDKIRRELEKNKNKPKKKTGFGARLEQVMKQQELARQQNQQKPGKKK
jgi:YidC/Oxa1 family membrane protein insertase